MSVIGEKFKTGDIVCTAGVNSLMREDERFRMFVHECLVRHMAGDWGDLYEEDRQANERALVEGSRLLSAYKANSLSKIWIITEADQASTCILFPDEY